MRSMFIGLRLVNANLPGKNQMRKYIWVFSFVILIQGSPLFSEEVAVLKPEAESKNDQEPGYHEHDGFYFRFYGMGIGYANLQYSLNQKPGAISDSYSSYGMQFGGTVLKNLIFFVGMDMIYFPSPWLQLNIPNNPLNFTPKHGTNIARAGLLAIAKCSQVDTTGPICTMLRPMIAATVRPELFSIATKTMVVVIYGKVPALYLAKPAIPVTI